MLIQKHLRNVSDESVVKQWSENAYYQYFCGMRKFYLAVPCTASELVRFRHRIGEKGIELIFNGSVRINTENDDTDHHDTAFIDSAVQEKNVTYPTEAKLHRKIIQRIKKLSAELNLPLRQSYTFVLKKVFLDQRFRNHPKNFKKARKADKKLRVIAGRLLRELQRNIKDNHEYDDLIALFERVLSQSRNSTQKGYSLHEPEVLCISKGKEHKNKKYEFGNKVSIIPRRSGLLRLYSRIHIFWSIAQNGC